MGAALKIFYSKIYRLEGSQSFVNVGAFYSLVVYIYISLPLIGYWLHDMGYGISDTNRMLRLNPSLDDILLIGFYGATYLSCFMLSFTLFSNKFKPSSRIVLFNTPSFHSLIFLFILTASFMTVLGFYLDFGNKSYLDKFLAVWSLPLLIRQIANHVSGISVIAVIGLLTYLISNFERYRTLTLILLLYEFFATIITLGGRSEVIQYLIAAALLFHLFVKKLRGSAVLLIIIIGLSLALIYGAIRSNALSDINDWTTPGINLLTENNEFDSLYATAIELNILKNNQRLPDIPWQLYLSDLTSLVPQQILSFTKMDYGNWYVTTLYPGYKGMGGGLAFGTLAEAIVGIGLPEVIIRAIIIGFIFALIHKWYLNHRNSFWATSFYIWFLVESYQCFRATSFIFLTYFTYRFVPYFILVLLINGIIKKLGHFGNIKSLSSLSVNNN